MASVEEGLSVLSLMFEFSTLVHLQIILLSLLIVAMRGRRDVSMTDEQRIREIEHGHFSPLVFTTTGGMGDAASQVYRRLGNLLTEKLELSYGEVITW